LWKFCLNPHDHWIIFFMVFSNWMIGVHQIQLFGGRWVDAKNWVNSQMPRAEIPQDMKNNLKAIGGIDDNLTT